MDDGYFYNEVDWQKSFSLQDTPDHMEFLADEAANSALSHEPDIVIIARPHAESSGSGGMFPNTFFFSFGDSGQSFLDQLFGGEALISQEVPSAVDQDGDIIVEVSKDQVDAARIAYAQAGMDLSVIEIVAAIGSALFENKTHSAFVTGAIETVSIFKEDIQKGLADLYYTLDGADGVYDGRYNEPSSYFDVGGYYGGGWMPPRHEP